MVPIAVHNTVHPANGSLINFTDPDPSVKRQQNEEINHDFVGFGTTLVLNNLSSLKNDINVTTLSGNKHKNLGRRTNYFWLAS